jgi:hypothetical protein
MAAQYGGESAASLGGADFPAGWADGLFDRLHVLGFNGHPVLVHDDYPCPIDLSRISLLHVRVIFSKTFWPPHSELITLAEEQGYA